MDIGGESLYVWWRGGGGGEACKLRPSKAASHRRASGELSTGVTLTSVLRAVTERKALGGGVSGSHQELQGTGQTPKAMA